MEMTLKFDQRSYATPHAYVYRSYLHTKRTTAGEYFLAGAWPVVLLRPTS